MMKRRSVFVWVLAWVAPVAGFSSVAACDDDTAAVSAETDSGTDTGSSPTPGTDASDNPGDGSSNVPDATIDAGTDAGRTDAGDSGAAFKTCTDTELAAATLFTNGADISFFNNTDGSTNYVNHCIRLPKGKDVGWYGDFAMHPLRNNAEPGTPIPELSSGNDSGRIVFPTAGKFSFHCSTHPDTMFGTVLVEP